jgi:hypothetical protein
MSMRLRCSFPFSFSWQKAAIVASIITTGLGATAYGAEPDPKLLVRGAEIILPFKQQLKQALQQGMTDGPDAAVDVCHLEAPAIAQSLTTDDIRLGRSSHKLRNPANAPSDWMDQVINTYLDAPEAQQPVVLSIADGRFGYAEPITTQPLCLTCHGENIAPAIQAQITEFYPNDQATGFRVGELRGIFWAEFPATH